MSWGDSEDEFVKCMKSTNNKKNVVVLKELAGKINPSGNHKWRDTGFSLLMHASLEETLPAVEVLVDQGADPTWENERGTTVFTMFSKRNQVEMAKYCAQKLEKSDLEDILNKTWSSGWTLLMQSSDLGNKEMVAWLIENGADVQAVMSTGWTALHAAAKRGSKDIVKLLLENGADPHATANHRDFGNDIVAKEVAASAGYPEVQQMIEDFLINAGKQLE